MFLSGDLGSDEGGFSMVARSWGATGHYLYGPVWVDRPPGLITLFAVANLGGHLGVRLAASVLALALVAACALAAGSLGGRRAARWAAWTAFAFGSSALLGANQLNGELAGGAAVTGSIAALVRARMSPTGYIAVLLGGVAGLLAAVAVLMKQNLVDGFVFAAVMTTLSALRGSHQAVRRTIGPPAVGFMVGSLVPLAAALVWAWSHAGVPALLFALFGFRAEAIHVMAAWSWAAPEHRLRGLLAAAVASGLLATIVAIAVRHWRSIPNLSPVACALTATGLVELLGIAGGGNYWTHYLVTLVPTVSIAAGLSVAREPPTRRSTRGLLVYAAAMTMVASPAQALERAHSMSAATEVGNWLASSAGERDSVVVTFTHPNVINASGLQPAYPYDWSLPLRTLDPHLRLLSATLRSGRATWVVRWDAPTAWGLDPSDRIDKILARHYRLIADVCGRPVWLRNGVHRPVHAPPVHCGPA